jgi:hypothetical protein
MWASINFVKILKIIEFRFLLTREISYKFGKEKEKKQVSKQAD